MEFLNNPNDLWKFKSLIMTRVSIVDLAKEYGIILEAKNSGQFNFRARCPFHKGKDGRQEKTPSLFFAQQSNSYCCFGCSSGGTIIDFVQQYEGVPLVVALEKLAKRAGIIDKDGKFDELKINEIQPIYNEPTKTIEPFLFEISNSIRNYIHLIVNREDFEKEFKWIEKVAAKADEFLFKIDYEDYSFAKDLSEKISKAIQDRIDKKGLK